MIRISPRAVSLFSGIVGLVSFAGGLVVKVELVRYPLLTVAIASLLFTVHEHIPSITLRDLSRSQTKAFDSLILFVIAATGALGQLEAPGVGDIYYVAAIATAGVLAYRIARDPIRPLLTVGQMVLFALILRASLWFSYPVYGADRFHFGAAGWIVNQGTIIPESITYYHNFPMAHIFVAAWTLLTDLPLNVGYFSLGIAESASLVVVYLLVRRVLGETRPALYGTLFVTVSGYHIKSGGEPFAQALLTGLMPVIFYLLFREHHRLDNRKTVVLFGLVVVGTLTQNIAPVILVGVVGVIVASRVALDALWPYLGTESVYGAKSLYGLLFLQIGFVWYYVADYLQYQVWRIARIVLFIGGTGQNEIENTGVAGVPKVAVFGNELPGIAMWAAPILSAALLVGLADYFSLREVVSERIEDVPVHYVALATIIFAGLSAVFAAGSSDAVRALPAVMVLIAPLAGFVLNKTRASRGQVGAMIACGLIVVVAFSGVLSPGVAKPEITDGSFHKTLDSDQVQGAEFAMRHSKKAQSGPFVYQYDYYSQASSGNYPDVVISEGFDPSSDESVNAFQKRAEDGETTVYLDYYRQAFNISRPKTNRVYASGNSSVYIGD